MTRYFWISPSGEMIFIKGSHINYIFNNPRKFGVTQQQIKQVYEPNYDDTIDFIKIAIRKGWIRGNYSDQRGGVIELEFKKPGLKAKRALKKLIHDNDFIEVFTNNDHFYLHDLADKRRLNKILLEKNILEKNIILRSPLVYPKPKVTTKLDPKPKGTTKFWISPKGKVARWRGLAYHLDFILKNPKKFGVQGVPLHIDLVEKAIENGWVRGIKDFTDSVELEFKKPISSMAAKAAREFIDSDTRNVFLNDDVFHLGNFADKRKLNQVLKEGAGYIRYWIDPHGKLIKVSGEHSDFIMNNLKLFPISKEEIEKIKHGKGKETRYDGIYDIALLNGWIRLGITQGSVPAINIEWKKLVDKAIRTLKKFIDENREKIVFIDTDDETYDVTNLSQMRKLNQALREVMGFVRYWINPTGKFIKLSGKHKDFIIDNSQLFGLNSVKVKKIMSKSNSEDRRDEILQNIAFSKGWVRCYIYKKELGVDFTKPSHAAIEAVKGFLSAKKDNVDNVYLNGIGFSPSYSPSKKEMWNKLKSLREGVFPSFKFLFEIIVRNKKSGNIYQVGKFHPDRHEKVDQDETGAETDLTTSEKVEKIKEQLPNVGDIKKLHGNKRTIDRIESLPDHLPASTTLQVQDKYGLKPQWKYWNRGNMSSGWINGTPIVVITPKNHEEEGLSQWPASGRKMSDTELHELGHYYHLYHGLPGKTSTQQLRGLVSYLRKNHNAFAGVQNDKGDWAEVDGNMIFIGRGKDAYKEMVADLFTHWNLEKIKSKEWVDICKYLFGK